MDHQGQIEELNYFEYRKEITDTDISLTDISDFFSDRREIFSGDLPSPLPSDVCAKILDADNLNVFTNKLYIDPIEIEIDFITESLDFNIIVFSTYFEKLPVTNISILGAEGIVFVSDPVPFNVPPSYEVVNFLTLLKEGPPFQNSQINYTHDSNIYDVDISGKRIIPFIYEPNFSTVEISYFFNTVIFTDNIQNEQRRSLSSSSFREISFEIWEEDLEAQKFLNDIKRFGYSIAGVPVFTEPMKFLSDPQGGTVIEVKESFDFYYNLQNLSRFILLKRLDDLDINEIKEFSSLDNENMEITVTNSAVNSYSPKKSICYPIILGIIDNVSFSHKRKDLVECKLKFTEFI